MENLETALKQKADNLFEWFEENSFTWVYGAYDRNTALVCEFYDWFTAMPDVDVAQEIGAFDEEGEVIDDKVAAFRKMVCTGCDQYIDEVFC